MKRILTITVVIVLILECYLTPAESFNLKAINLLRQSSSSSTLRLRQSLVQLQANRQHREGSPLTLSRFMIEATRSNPDHADLDGLIESIQLACKSIAQVVSKSGVSNLNTNNHSLDKSVSLYENANQILKNSLKFSGKLGLITSENENELLHPILVEESWNSKYIAVFDPLDAVGDIDIGLVTGTIFAIFKGENEDECLVDYGETISESSQQCLLKNLVPSTNLVAAGYCMYSSTTTLMFSMGEGLHGFTLDPSIGEFILTHPNIKIPKRGNIYSINEAYSSDWSQGLKTYVNDIKDGRGESKEKYSSRYIGSFIGDVHRTLLKGGIFGYPGNAKHVDGKLVYLHEVAPLAYLVEQAGGKATALTQRVRVQGFGRALDKKPASLVEHVPIFLGSFDDVTELEKYISSH